MMIKYFHFWVYNIGIIFQKINVNTFYQIFLIYYTLRPISKSFIDNILLLNYLLTEETLLFICLFIFFLSRFTFDECDYKNFNKKEFNEMLIGIKFCLYKKSIQTFL